MNHPISWVKVERYAELTGDTVESVKARRKTGKWIDGNESKVVDGRIWVNLQAAEGWVEKWQPNRQTMPA